MQDVTFRLFLDVINKTGSVVHLFDSSSWESVWQSCLLSPPEQCWRFARKCRSACR